ncbi:MAG: hypothetical protein Q9159_004736 [Coniocarpon cinnabarinum]
MASLAQSTTLLPVFSPLLCPDWYTIVSHWGGNYIACCPSSYTLHLTTGPTPAARSAYNATCYSNLPSLTTVTAYDGVTITSTQGYNDPTAQAYAHALDGYAPATVQGQQITVVAGPAPTDSASSGSVASQTRFSEDPSDNDPTPTPESSSTSLSGAAIAGIVVGAFAFCLLATLLAWIIFLLRRRRRDDDHVGLRSQHEKLPPSTLSSTSAATLSTGEQSPGSTLAAAPVAVRQTRSRPSGRPRRNTEEHSTAKVDEAMNDTASSIADLGPASPTSMRGFGSVHTPDTMRSPPPRFSHVVSQDRRNQQQPLTPAEMESRLVQRYELPEGNAPWTTARRKETSQPTRAVVELPGDKPWRR